MWCSCCWASPGWHSACCLASKRCQALCVPVFGPPSCANLGCLLLPADWACSLALARVCVPRLTSHVTACPQRSTGARAACTRLPLIPVILARAVRAECRAAGSKRLSFESACITSAAARVALCACCGLSRRAEHVLWLQCSQLACEYLHAIRVGCATHGPGGYGLSLLVRLKRMDSCTRAAAVHAAHMLCWSWLEWLWVLTTSSVGSWVVGSADLRLCAVTRHAAPSLLY